MIGNSARSGSRRSLLNKKTECFEPVFLSQRGKGSDSCLCFHISTNIESYGDCQASQSD